MIRISKNKKSNPYNKDLISKLKVEKEQDSFTGEIFYRIMLDGEWIADAVTNERSDYIVDVSIDKKYHRQGIGTFIYDYVEKDRGIKLRPSGGKELKGHSALGKAFWQNRLKKQNPTDKDFLSKVKIQKVLNKEYISYEAFYNNKYIAGVDFNPKTKTIWDVWVGPNYRRKGLATFIYNKIEKDQKIKLKPSDTLFPDGQEFWKARLKTG